MVYRCAVLLVLAMALASCSPGRRANATTTQSDAETANRPALTQPAQPMDAAGRSYMLTPGAGVGRAVPEMEPGRQINTQDCTKEVAMTGNLKCQ
ncbi:MAG: hypothetical protein JOZ85_12835 [Betaproteobacteria bacterium]|nr:hypothetical protein [Betaproteobacteria bacterium]